MKPLFNTVLRAADNLWSYDSTTDYRVIQVVGGPKHKQKISHHIFDYSVTARFS